MGRDFVKRDRTARLVRVAHLLFQHPRGLTAADIAEHIGMNVRTAYRDLGALDAEVGVKVWQDGNRYGAEAASFLPPLKLSLYEAVTLFLSARLMQRFQDHRDPHVVSAIDKLANILPIPIAQHVHASVAWLNELPPDDTRARIFDLIATGWAEGRKVKIRYPHERRLSERSIAPYFLEPNPGGHSRYVIGHDSVSNQVRTFRIERIEHAELTNDHFDVPPEFSVADRLRHAWGISDEDTVHVRLRFHDRAAAERVVQTNWHPSQHLELEPDGSLLMTLDVGGLLEITPWLLGWGSAVEVLDPPELRHSLSTTAAEMAGRYPRPS
jgi:predicted DNA-binding transcriptional regulator YafY